jgi:hypothetical protein
MTTSSADSTQCELLSTTATEWAIIESCPSHSADEGSEMKLKSGNNLPASVFGNIFIESVIYSTFIVEQKEKL